MRKFSCGVEEPLRPNDQLYSFNEGTGAIDFAQFADANLNRYSFVAQEESTSEAELLPVVAKIASVLGGLATSLFAFLKSPAASSSHRSRALATRLAREGWHTIEGSDVYLATKPVSLEGGQKLAPMGAEPMLSGWVILLGALPDEESLLLGPFRETLRMLALTHRLQPSQEFLAACGRARIAVAYAAKDGRERIGLVVVTPANLSFAVRCMQRDGTVGRVLSGLAAHQVWRD